MGRTVKSCKSRKRDSATDDPKICVQNNYDSPDWYDLNISKLINLPISGPSGNYTLSDKNIGLGNVVFNNRYIKHYSFNNKSNCEIINTLLINTSDSDITKLTKTFEKSIQTVRTKFVDDSNKINTKIKTLTTKYNKNVSNINKVTICKKYRIYPDSKQKEKLHKWFDECRKVYDYCIEKYNENTSYFDNGYMSVKVLLFEEMYGTNDKPAPYSILTDEVRIFCSNLKSCLTNLKNGNISSFEMKPKNNHNGQCLFIPKTSMTENGPYIKYLGKMLGMKHINFDEVTHDCRLIYNKDHKSYTLLVPVNKEKTVIKGRKKIVAVDPGGKIFMAYFSPEDFGYLGYEFRGLLLKELEKVSILQRILSRGYNNYGSKIKNKQSLIRKINLIYERMRNLRDELHNKIAKFLCENYDTILLPKFETQKMLKTDPNYRKAQKNVETIYNEKGSEAGKEALRQYKKKKRLNKKDKFVLNMLSHYRFRQHLTHKASEYGCKIKVVTEEYTSQTCTNCGHKSTNYDYREKKCEKCNYKIDRDLNGSRNILLKNISGYIKQEDLSINSKSNCDNDSEEDFINEEKGFNNEDYSEYMDEDPNDSYNNVMEYFDNLTSDKKFGHDNEQIEKYTKKILYKIIKNKADRSLDKKSLVAGRIAPMRNC